MRILMFLSTCGIPSSHPSLYRLIKQTVHYVIISNRIFFLFLRGRGSLDEHRHCPEMWRLTLEMWLAGTVLAWHLWGPGMNTQLWKTKQDKNQKQSGSMVEYLLHWKLWRLDIEVPSSYSSWSGSVFYFLLFGVVWKCRFQWQHSWQMLRIAK